MMLQGKVGVVTGATAGLGRATAFTMAREGAAVVLTGRNTEVGEAAAAEIRDSGGRAVWEVVDVVDEDAIARMVERALSEYGRLDIAYNNAGVESPACPVHEIDMATVKAAFDVNYFSILNSMKYEIPAMLESGGGAIVNATSVWGLNAGAERSTYIAAKHAISGLTKTTALELATQNIRVNAVAPGPILTPMMLRDWQGEVEKAAGNVPMGRVGEADEVADAVVWLCSERAGFITGHVLPIDGGMMCAVG